MSLWSKLFGGSDGEQDQPSAVETYHGFDIYPEPIKEAGGYRVAARIEQEIDGALRRHKLIRADVCSTVEEAVQLSVAKAKAVIDEQGQAIFE